MFKSIGKAFNKIFKRDKQAEKYSMAQAIQFARSERPNLEQLDKEKEKPTISTQAKRLDTLNSKKAKNLAIEHTSNAMARNVQKLNLNERTIRPFGNFRPIKSTWYLPRKVKI